MLPSIDDTYPNDCKRFWHFIKRLRKDNSGIWTLITESDVNQQFHDQSAFTKEDNIPYILSNNHPSINNLTFSVNEIQKLLQELKHGEAPGPDNIPTWILQTCSAEK